MTRSEASVAIRNAKAIYVQPRMSTSERWVRIAKREAEYLLGGFERAGEIDIEVDQQKDGTVYLS